MNKKLFEDACNLILGSSFERTGIGTLGEKTIHIVLKFALEPDQNNHEIKVGSFYADIKNENGIIEIQTRNFNTLRKKLALFLEENIVTIVFPVAFKKHLIWINNENGEITKRRKSPKIGSVYEIFFELYRIKQFLIHPNLRFKIVLIDIAEYRNLDGWSKDKKKGSSRHERIPENFIGIVDIKNVGDYAKLMPEKLPENFTSKDFKRESGLSQHKSQTALNVLRFVGAVEQVGKQGNRIVYKRGGSGLNN
jgi:hypothetical protein